MPNFRNQATGTIAANDASITLAWRECFNGGVGVQVTGTWAGTLELQTTLDGTNYRPVLMRLTSTEATAPNTTANGIFYANVIGSRVVRVTSTAWTSGTATITLVGLPG
jgi:hypothetical protein